MRWWNMSEMCRRKGVWMNSRFADDSLTWRKLCRAAALERDPDELSRIIHRITSALKAQQRRLRRIAGTRRTDVPHISSGLNRAA